jgi:hypothetical protein
MKQCIVKAVSFLLIGAITSCGLRREIQADFVHAELIKIDKVSRFEKDEMLLTFRCKNKVDFVSFVPVSNQYHVGSKYQVLLPR